MGTRCIVLNGTGAVCKLSVVASSITSRPCDREAHRCCQRPVHKPYPVSQVSRSRVGPDAVRLTSRESVSHMPCTACCSAKAAAGLARWTWHTQTRSMYNAGRKLTRLSLYSCTAMTAVTVLLCVLLSQRSETCKLRAQSPGTCVVSACTYPRHVPINGWKIEAHTQAPPCRRSQHPTCQWLFSTQQGPCLL